jgi:hypothetical protein
MSRPTSELASNTCCAHLSGRRAGNDASRRLGAYLINGLQQRVAGGSGASLRYCR